MVSDVLLSAVIQALVLAATLVATFVGITLWFSGKFSEISSSINSMDSSVDNVEDSLQDVDLKEIEKTVLRLEYALGAEVEGDNSVHHELPESGIEVTISLVEEPADDLSKPIDHIEIGDFDPDDLADEDADADDDEDDDEMVRQLKQVLADEVEGPAEDVSVAKPANLPDSEITYITMEFDERINSRAVVNQLSSDIEIEEFELDMFDYECGFTALSPIEMQFSVPTTDYAKIADWLEEALKKIDQYHSEFAEEAEKFDREVESVLKE